jgi:MYXO-CTERM domain-containing protein
VFYGFGINLTNLSKGGKNMHPSGFQRFVSSRTLLLPMLAVGLCWLSPSVGRAEMFTYSNGITGTGQRSAKADFEVSGDTLTITLTNTAAFQKGYGDTLTDIGFNTKQIGLTFVNTGKHSNPFAGSSVVHNRSRPPTGGSKIVNTAGNRVKWPVLSDAYGLFTNAQLADGTTLQYDVSAANFNIGGSGHGSAATGRTFKGNPIPSANNPNKYYNGDNYGLIADGTPPTKDPQARWVDDSVVITLVGHGVTAIDLSKITNVTFSYSWTHEAASGTRTLGPNVLTPEPSALVSAGMGLLGLAFAGLWYRRRHLLQTAEDSFNCSQPLA